MKPKAIFFILIFMSAFPFTSAEDYAVRLNGVLVDGCVDCSITGKSGLADTGTFMFIVGGGFHPMLNYHGVVVQYGKRISFAALGFAKGMVVGQPVEMKPPVSFANGCIMSPLNFLAEAIGGEIKVKATQKTLEVTAPEPLQIGDIIPEAKTLADELVKKDLIVQQGDINYTNAIAIFSAGYTTDCNGNNAGFPYFCIQAPPTPGLQFEPQLPYVLQMRNDEALVIIGQTPPPSVYFSYRSYLLNRFYADENPPQQKKLFASLGDTINKYNLNENRTPEKRHKKFFVVISTADRSTLREIRSALQRCGISIDDLYIDVIPGDKVRFGTDQSGDGISLLHRVALFNDKEQGEKYRKRPTLEILRITPARHIRPDFLSAPPLRSRISGRTEDHLLPTVEQLREAIITKYSKKYDVYEPKTSVWLVEGYEAIKKRLNVLGETRDTLYLRSEEFSFDKGDIIIVYGVNHVMSRKARYSNVSCYGAEFFNGFGGITNLDYKGTAAEFIQDGKKAEALYVWKFARRKLDETTFVVPIDKKKTYEGINYGDKAFMGFRAYIDPITKVGPSASEVILDRVIVLKEK